MAIVSVKMRMMPSNQGAAGRTLVWLVHPAQTTIVQKARPHDVEDGWVATYMIRSDLFVFGQMRDDLPEIRQGFLTADELRRIVQLQGDDVH